jgi:hypothetical protein
MERWLLGIYLLVSGLAVVQAALVVVQTWEHHRFARSRLSVMRRYPRKGRALVVVPCRGVDVGLQRNLRTLFHQDYGDYRVRFVVESAADPACAVIRRLMAAHPATDAELLIAGNAEREGQKVHNLRFATASLPAGVEYLAFVDSDARLRRQWLRALLARLDRPGVGATTGYRWFVPSRSTFANHLLHSINSHIAVLFGSQCPTIVWGGSWAIRRDQFEVLGVRAAWAGTLSDDLVASRVLRRAGLRVLFEPACLVTSPADVTVGGLLEFVRRQYLMGRLYVPGGWALALLMTTFVNAASVANVGVLAGALATGLVEPWIPATFCAVLYVLSMFGGLLRQDLALSYFPHLRKTLRKARRFEIWTGPLVALVNWTSVLGSMAGGHVRWRGIAYSVEPDGKVTATDRLGAAAWRFASQAEEPSLPEDLSEPAVIPMPSIRVRSAAGASAEKSERRCA